MNAKRLLPNALAVVLIGTAWAASGLVSGQIVSAGTPSMPTATVLETRVSTIASSAANRSWEPAVAADPLNPQRLAVVYAHGLYSILPVVRISHDGGITWRTTTGRPPGGGIHFVVAWGPGPVSGSSRLYLAIEASSGVGVRLGTSYSDNEGGTWSHVRVQMDTPAWVGGMPDLTVDTIPTSPNYGVVYATYNWQKSRTTGPGLRVLASADYGVTFRPVEVPALPLVPGYRARHRIGYRLETAPDGAVFVAWYQADLRFWFGGDPLNVGRLSNVGRLRVGIARLAFNRVSGTWLRGPSVTAVTLPRTLWNIGSVKPDGLTNNPQWAIPVAVDPATGTVMLAVGADGAVRVCAGGQAGLAWTCRSLPAPPKVNGRAQWIAKPDLVAGAGFLAVTMRIFDKVGGTSGHAYSLSGDGGVTWTRPTPISAVRWRSARVAGALNGVGLRNRATVTADGTTVFFVYGDGRYGVSGVNRTAVFGARITVTVTPSLVPSASPSASASVVPPG